MISFQNTGDCILLTRCGDDSHLTDLCRATRTLLPVKHPLRNNLAPIGQFLFQKPEDLRRMAKTSTGEILLHAPGKDEINTAVEKTDSKNDIEQ